MTRQEMFDRAVNGLRSQGFERCFARGSCRYTVELESKTLHCAWGWVDLALSNESGTVLNLFEAAHRRRLGQSTDEWTHYLPPVGSVSDELDYEDAQWARELQVCHDDSSMPSEMEGNLRRFGYRHGLVWPEEVSP